MLFDFLTADARRAVLLALCDAATVRIPEGRPTPLRAACVPGRPIPTGADD
jgi:hypothetical protein